MSFPADRPGRCVDRLQPAPRLLTGIRCDRAAVVVRVLGELGRLVGLGEGAAPVDGGDIQGVRCWAVGRAVPLHAAEKSRAAVHASNDRHLVEVSAGGDRQFIEHFVAVAVEHAQQTILAGDSEQVARLAFHRRAEERAHLAQVAVVGVVGTELLVPEQLAGLDV